MSNTLKRVIASVVVLFVWSGANLIVSAPAVLISGQAAGQQFANSEVSYTSSLFWMSAFNGAGLIISFLFVLTLVAIWWKPAKQWITAMLAAMCLLLTAIPRADAYYDQNDYTEVYFILPNESAFFIPEVGANKDSQSAFGSVAYLQANKIPAKRFQIPHAKLAGSSFWSNYYVPTGRLIIVDRTPYNREWVASSNRGTSTRDESLPCQSAEGLDVTVGISISAFVTEENAATFLYWFGVNSPSGDRKDPNVIFTSVFNGRSLQQIMDTVGRGRVQALVCEEVASRPLDKVNSEATKIMDTIQQKVSAYLGSRGITLDYIGWADTFTFDSKVQDSINRQYISAKDKEIADRLVTSTATVQALASAEATRTLANKWNGSLPTGVSLSWLPSSITDWLSSWSSRK
jgi:hypothetical protein